MVLSAGLIVLKEAISEISLLYVYHACWGNLGMQTKDLSLKLWSDQICTKGEYQNNLITIRETWELLRISDTQDIPQKNTINEWLKFLLDTLKV